jgi:hypothetical protein
VINNVLNITRTVTVRQKAVKYNLSYNLVARKLKLVSTSPQAEDIPAARKRPPLEEPLPTTNANLGTDTQPNAGATGHWIEKEEEDAKLNSAISNTPLKQWEKEY